MTMTFARTDRSVIGRWWWTVDKWLLVAIGALALLGIILCLAASPSVAARIGYDSFYFVKRELFYLPIALALMLAVSLLEPRGVRRLAVVVFLIAFALMALTPAIGTEIKGARRWIYLAGLSIQPSEFIKPAFAVVTAWMFAGQRQGARIPGNFIAIVLYFAVAAILAAQPDIGMLFVVSAVWFAQFFLAGLRMYWVVLFTTLGMAALVAAYFTLPHVASRVDRFLNPQSGDSYQVERAMEAFSNGGLYGRGPGEGVAKLHLPDAHSDFVFAVAGEEFGLFACLGIVTIFGFVILRGIGRLLEEQNLFVLLSGAGLLVQFGLQAVVNMASELHLMPTKGMTLPFISYGGSSLLALALGMGMVLALTRRRVGPGGIG
ncbi:MAG TPA: putative peptidoglycan glycosyltransferase FtsW [Alphaproteobacteria bacterium]|nr:putative peptidoglycan glycosyltransferase FtsW [Alphaproteobacteria bacterium]